MARPRLKAAFENAATAAMIVASLALIYLVVVTVGERSARSPYEVGEKFDGKLAGVSSLKSDTLILYVSPTCRFCEASMDFYRRVRDQAKVTRIIVMGREPEPILKDHYVTRGRIGADGINTVQVRQTRFFATPTLLLVDDRFRVKGVWHGQLDEGSQQLVLAALK